MSQTGALSSYINAVSLVVCVTFEAGIRFSMSATVHFSFPFLHTSPTRQPPATSCLSTRKPFVCCLHISTFLLCSCLKYFALLSECTSISNLQQSARVCVCVCRVKDAALFVFAFRCIRPSACCKHLFFLSVFNTNCFCQHASSLPSRLQVKFTPLSPSFLSPSFFPVLTSHSLTLWRQ